MSRDNDPSLNGHPSLASVRQLTSITMNASPSGHRRKATRSHSEIVENLPLGLAEHLAIIWFSTRVHHSAPECVTKPACMREWHLSHYEAGS